MLAAASLRPAGGRAPLGAKPLQGLALPGGGYLVVARGADHALVDAPALASLSALHVLVACSLDEHVMICHAEGWADGRCRWRVAHDGQRSWHDLAVDGTPPPALAAIRDRAAQDQAAEDAGPAEVDFFFDVPLQLAYTLTGFKHDEPPPGIDLAACETLESAATAARPWWRLWG